MSSGAEHFGGPWLAEDIDSLKIKEVEVPNEEGALEEGENIEEDSEEDLEENPQEENHAKNVGGEGIPAGEGESAEEEPTTEEHREVDVENMEEEEEEEDHEAVHGNDQDQSWPSSVTLTTNWTCQEDIPTGMLASYCFAALNYFIDHFIILLLCSLSQASTAKDEELQKAIIELQQDPAKHPKLVWQHGLLDYKTKLGVGNSKTLR
ncbi:hypothetical protein U1Q18_020396 [Sarracenia purpurea var. burkii]